MRCKEAGNVANKRDKNLTEDHAQREDGKTQLGGEEHGAEDLAMQRSRIEPRSIFIVNETSTIEASHVVNLRCSYISGTKESSTVCKPRRSQKREVTRWIVKSGERDYADGADGEGRKRCHDRRWDGGLLEYGVDAILRDEEGSGHQCNHDALEGA